MNHPVRANALAAVPDQVEHVDAAIATLYGTVAADSLLAPDGSGGPVRMSENYAGTSLSLLAEDWWMPQASVMRRDPRFVQFARDIGLLAFWRSNGWPDLCAPEGDAVTCK